MLLKEVNADNEFFRNLSLKTRLQLYLRHDHWIVINKYLRYLRLEEYYYNRQGIASKMLAYFWARKKNKLGNQLGFFINANSLGPYATIYHHGSIIINGDAHIGANCCLHGMNCIGNKGDSSEAPIIGDNVDIGIGAVILGGVKIANGCKIGANAVVINSCLEEGAILVGVPAVVKHKQLDEEGESE